MPKHSKITALSEIPKSSSESQFQAVNWKKNKAARREMIFKLVTQGVTPATMAGLMRVSKKTVQNDMDAIKNAQGALVRNFDPHQATGGHIINLEYVFQQAMKQYHGTPATRARERRGWLETALRARAQMVTLQMDTGLIPRAGEDGVEKIFQVTGPDGRSYDIRQSKPADLRQLAAHLTQQVTSNPKLQRALTSMQQARAPQDDEDEPTPLIQPA